MINKRTLYIADANGEKASINISFPETHPWYLDVESDLVAERYEGEDLIEALTQFWLDLEKANKSLLCVGCMKNAFSSRMSRNMSGGRKAYMLKMGEAATLDSLRDIFDSAPANEVGRVGEQQAFIDAWYESL